MADAPGVFDLDELESIFCRFKDCVVSGKVV